MAGEPQNGNGADERKLRARLRLAAFIVVAFCFATAVLVDVFGRLFVRPDFHVGDPLFALLIGAMCALAGVEIAARLPGGPK